jgi:hypothetical protein
MAATREEAMAGFARSWIAIALSKARKKGKRVPRKKK